MIKLIVAIDKNNLIGHGEKLPWHIKEELAFFKKMTLGHSLVMGKKTYDGLPSKLKGRNILVLARPEEKPEYDYISSFDEVIKKFKDSKDIIYIAGGKSIYEQFYKNADEIYISKIHEAFEGDTYLDLDLSNYEEKIYEENEKFTVYKYTKKDVK